MRRKIVLIDEDKCDGCGLCVPACAEGAIRIIDGKARLIDDSYCDGLGACLGECPRGAITIVEREAAPFDPHASEKGGPTPVRDGHVSETPTGERAVGGPHAKEAAQEGALPCGCPGTAVVELPAFTGGDGESEPAGPSPSRLGNWPVQLRLVPVKAHCLKGARLLLAADCTAFAYPDFHRELLPGRVLLVGCPKLDDASFYRQKLAEILAHNDVSEVTVVHMEVPCCYGLASIAAQAARDAGREVRLKVIKLGVDGRVLESSEVEPALP